MTLVTTLVMHQKQNILENSAEKSCCEDDVSGLEQKKK